MTAATSADIPSSEQPAPSSSAPAVDPGLLASAEALWHDLSGLAHDYLRLAALEAQRAGESLVSIIVFGIVTGLLVVSAWLGLAGALVLWLIGIGWHASLAMLLAVVINLAGAAGFVFAIRAKSHNLRFPAIVNSLRPRRGLHAADDAHAPATAEQNR